MRWKSDSDVISFSEAPTVFVTIVIVIDISAVWIQWEGILKGIELYAWWMWGRRRSRGRVLCITNVGRPVCVFLQRFCITFRGGVILCCIGKEVMLVSLLVQCWWTRIGVGVDGWIGWLERVAGVIEWRYYDDGPLCVWDWFSTRTYCRDLWGMRHWVICWMKDLTCG